MTRALTLIYGAERIPFQVRNDDSRSTRVAIHVEPDSTVLVDAPPDFADDAVRKAVQNRARWVVDHVHKARQRHSLARPKEYVSGEEVLYLGRRYVLKVVPVEAKPLPVRLIANRLEVQTRLPVPEDVRGRVRAWYRVKARDYFSRRIEELSKRLAWIDTPPPFRLLEMSKQWGSCSARGEIILNPNLIKAPRPGVEYVLVHELSHLKHHDHGPEFWRLIDVHAGDWKPAKQMLDSWVELLSSESAQL